MVHSPHAAGTVVEDNATEVLVDVIVVVEVVSVTVATVVVAVVIVKVQVKGHATKSRTKNT